MGRNIIFITGTDTGVGKTVLAAALTRSLRGRGAAGYPNKILLSHDAGWYDPSQINGQPDGDGIRGYNALCEDFIPRMRASGISEEEIMTITHSNPVQAFSFDAG